MSRRFVIEMKPKDDVMAQKLVPAFPEGLRFLVNLTEVGTVRALQEKVQDVLREHGLTVEPWGIHVGNVYEKPSTDNPLNVRYLNTGHLFPEGNSFAAFQDLSTIVVEISKPLVLYYIEQGVRYNPEWLQAAQNAGFEVPVHIPPNAAAPAARKKQSRRLRNKRKSSRRN